ncbi:GCN5-related N-acetyltransferase (plasmid) [Rhizobium leguminosarum bv. trifolii WSM2304]|uniref:GCN5-related N-acetyltransferase n=1 Tax=Rhizobium leguminosarum bv. trifolii (strain WSM2304) TaxID=395492 RepID=A0ABF7QZ62_RHILW|nr:GCN5-related N-acetyltransferase [Rhizobium leguminosarum bv. trifolii WSM2304]
MGGVMATKTTTLCMLALYSENSLSGSRLFSRSPLPGGSSQQAWRLRSVAILPGWQRKGLGSRLVEAYLRHANDHRATVIWCSARSEAFSFYESFGFRVGDLYGRENATEIWNLRL